MVNHYGEEISLLELTNSRARQVCSRLISIFLQSLFDLGCTGEHFHFSAQNNFFFNFFCAGAGKRYQEVLSLKKVKRNILKERFLHMVVMPVCIPVKSGKRVNRKITDAILKCQRKFDVFFSYGNSNLITS